MLIAFSAATYPELQSFQGYLKDNFKQNGEFQFQKDGLHVFLLITGVGMTMTTHSLTKFIITYDPDYVINVGIAGAYSKANLPIGSVVQVRSAIFGDLGIEMGNGKFKTVFESNLASELQFPFTNGNLVNEFAPEFLKDVTALTVNKVNGTNKSIQAVEKKFDADIETMESAAVFYTCLAEGVSFIELRSISNLVEKRNKEAWDIGLALSNLLKESINLLDLLSELYEKTRRKPAGFKK